MCGTGRWCFVGESNRYSAYSKIVLRIFIDGLVKARTQQVSLHTCTVFDEVSPSPTIRSNDTVLQSTEGG